MLRRDQPAMTVLLGALIAVAPLAMDIYLASMPSMTRALSATPEQVQLTLSLYMYGWGATQIFVGPLTDRFGRRPALIAGLVLFVAASAACAASRTIETLIAARVAQAVGVATIAVVPRAVVRDLYTGDRAARMLSLMGVVLGIAPIVAPIIGSHLHLWFGWQANFVFVAAYGAIALVCVVVALPETLKAKNKRAIDPTVVLANYRRLLQSRTYVGYALVAAFAASGLFAFLAGSAFAFVTVLGTGERGFGLLFGLFMVALMTTMPQATAGGLTPFPEISGSAASLLLFCQFMLASTAALIVGVTFDGTQRPMATVIAVASTLTFIAFRTLVRHRGASAGATV